MSLMNLAIQEMRSPISPLTAQSTLKDSQVASSSSRKRLQRRAWTCKHHSASSQHQTPLLTVSTSSDILYQDPIATYNPAPISNLTDALPEISFKEYFGAFTPRAFPTRVILTSTTYPASLSSILKETKKSVLQAYLETRAALALAGYLSTDTEAWRAVRSLEERLRGIKPGAIGDRAEYCVGRVEGAMGFAAGRYFVKEVFGGKSREIGTKVITGKYMRNACVHPLMMGLLDIVEAFKRSLDNISWMDKKSARAAAEKV